MGSVAYRRYVPIAITFLIGMVIIIQYFLVPAEPVEPYQFSLKKVGSDLTNWANLLAAFTVGFGFTNVMLIHGRHISRRTPGQWYYSAWLVFMALVMAIIGLGGESRLGINVTADQYEWMQTYVFGACSGAMYSSLAFYITSATIRSFRARNIETAALLIVGFITLMSRTPAFQIYSPIVEAGIWINDFIVRSSFRGIAIGAGLGSILLGIRTLMGWETGYFGRRD